MSATHLYGAKRPGAEIPFADDSPMTFAGASGDDRNGAATAEFGATLSFLIDGQQSAPAASSSKTLSGTSEKTARQTPQQRNNQSAHAASSLENVLQPRSATVSEFASDRTAARVPATMKIQHQNESKQVRAASKVAHDEADSSASHNEASESSDGKDLGLATASVGAPITAARSSSTSGPARVMPVIANKLAAEKPGMLLATSSGRSDGRATAAAKAGSATKTSNRSAFEPQYRPATEPDSQAVIATGNISSGRVAAGAISDRSDKSGGDTKALVGDRDQKSGDLPNNDSTPAGLSVANQRTTTANHSEPSDDSKNTVRAADTDQKLAANSASGAKVSLRAYVDAPAGSVSTINLSKTHLLANEAASVLKAGPTEGAPSIAKVPTTNGVEGQKAARENVRLAGPQFARASIATPPAVTGSGAESVVNGSPNGVISSAPTSVKENVNSSDDSVTSKKQVGAAITSGAPDSAEPTDSKTNAAKAPAHDDHVVPNSLSHFEAKQVSRPGDATESEHNAVTAAVRPTEPKSTKSFSAGTASEADARRMEIKLAAPSNRETIVGPSSTETVKSADRSLAADRVQSASSKVASIVNPAKIASRASNVAPEVASRDELSGSQSPGGGTNAGSTRSVSLRSEAKSDKSSADSSDGSDIYISGANIPTLLNRNSTSSLVSKVETASAFQPVPVADAGAPAPAPDRIIEVAMHTSSSTPERTNSAPDSDSLTDQVAFKVAAPDLTFSLDVTGPKANPAKQSSHASAAAPTNATRADSISNPRSAESVELAQVSTQSGDHSAVSSAPRAKTEGEGEHSELADVAASATTGNSLDLLDASGSFSISGSDPAISTHLGEVPATQPLATLVANQPGIRNNAAPKSATLISMTTGDGARTGNDEAASPRTSETPSARAVQEPSANGEPARIANFQVELGGGQTAQAMIRERAGSIDIRIVTPTAAAAHRISGEVESLRQNLDAVGMRLGQTEVSYQPGEGGGRGNGGDQRAPQKEPSGGSENIFTLSEVTE
jgi:hypothetical protein